MTKKYFSFLMLVVLAQLCSCSTVEAPKRLHLEPIPPMVMQPAEKSNVSQKQKAEQATPKKDTHIAGGIDDVEIQDGFVQVFNPPVTYSADWQTSTIFQPPVLITSKFDFSTSRSIMESLGESAINAVLHAPRLSQDEMASKTLSDASGTTSTLHGDIRTPEDVETQSILKFVFVLVFVIIIQKVLNRDKSRKDTPA